MRRMFDLLLEFKYALFGLTRTRFGFVPADQKARKLTLSLSLCSPRIWSESRPAQEIDQFGDLMDEQLKAIQAKEEEQGTSSASASIGILGARFPGRTPSLFSTLGRFLYRCDRMCMLDFDLTAKTCVSPCRTFPS